MQWIAPSEKDVSTNTLEKRLWDAADQFRANSGLKAQEYSGPILGLIFLRFAEVRFAAQRAKLEKAGGSSRRGSRVDEPGAYHTDAILYLAPNARFDFLLNLPEAADIGAKVNEDMRDIEKHNPQLAGVLPKTYNLFPGHEKLPRVASPLGDIPKGWEVKRLANVADVNRRQINARTAPEGRMGNGSLRSSMGWDEPTYNSVKNQLLASGQVVSGKGRGGSVSLTET